VHKVVSVQASSPAPVEAPDADVPRRILGNDGVIRQLKAAPDHAPPHADRWSTGTFAP